MISDLLVLSKSADPFHSGSPSERKRAEWFAALFERFQFKHGVHLRAIHYKLVSLKEPVLRWDGKPYEHNEDDWKRMQRASAHARYLGLVDPTAFTDQRSPEPFLFAPEPREPPDVNWYVEDFEGFSLPHIDANLHFWVNVPDVVVEGYDYDPGDQPYHIEVWSEKSTMNDILLPLCEQWHCNFVPGLGTASITRIIETLHRVASTLRMGRPVRIFYISDYDKAGRAMPVQVSRQIEFWNKKYGSETADIKLQPLVLTEEQIVEYDLPRLPGSENCELDALEAIHPGILENILESVIRQYRDEGLEEHLQEQDYEATQSAQTEWTDSAESTLIEIGAIEPEIRNIAERYSKKLRKLNEEMQSELDPLRGRIEELEIQMTEHVDDAGNLTPAVYGRVEPEKEPPDETDYLFDSQRTFLDQLAVYKRKQGK